MIVSIVIFSLVILVHEFGHFYVAKKCGVYVEEFAMGMGRIIFKKQGKETLYTLRMFPIGGFCRMRGEDENETEIVDGSFNSANVYRRIMIIVAGVISNVLLAIVGFTIVTFYMGTTTLKIDKTIDGFPIEMAGLKKGDEIKTLNGKKLLNFNDLNLRISKLGNSGERSVKIKYIENESKTKKETTLNLKLDKESNRYIMGFIPEYLNGNLNKIKDNNIGMIKSIDEGFKSSAFYTKYTILGFKDLVTMNLKKDDLAGPIGIVSEISNVYDESVKVGGLSLGVLSTISFVAIISINIAVFNLLPMPALDGGRLVFLIIELITGKQVPQDKEGLIHFIGFVFLILLAVYVAFNDIIKLF